MSNKFIRKGFYEGSVSSYLPKFGSLFIYTLRNKKQLEKDKYGDFKR